MLRENLHIILESVYQINPVCRITDTLTDHIHMYVYGMQRNNCRQVVHNEIQSSTSHKK